MPRIGRLYYLATSTTLHSQTTSCDSRW